MTLLAVADRLPATSYAVVVGISQYGPKLQLARPEQLRFPETDAAAIYSIFLSAQAGNIPPENVRLLLGPAATKQAVSEAVSRWLMKAAPGDTVFFYFSGHGHLEGGQGYLVTYDAVRSDIPHTAYPLSELRQALRGIRAKTKLILIDACHSGALNQTAATAEGLRQNVLKLDDSTISIAASAAGGNALEGGGPGDRHTLFGQFLISGMDGYADADCNGVVTAGELAGYLDAQIAKASKGIQKPVSAVPVALRSLQLARYARPRCSGASAPDDRGDLRVRLDRFNCHDSPAVIQLDGRTNGSICAQGALWIPGLPRGTYKVRVSRAGMLPREESVAVKPPGENVAAFELQPRPLRSDAEERDWTKAVDLYNKGGATHYKDALAVLEKLRSERPGDPDIAYRIGLVHKVEGQNAQARAAFESALALDASHLMARSLLADLIALERPSDAIRLLFEVQELMANDVFSSVVLSRAYQKLHLCSESVQWAKTASERAPAGNDLQAEPLVELGASLRACAKESQVPDAREKYYGEAEAAFLEAKQRLEQLQSGAGGRVWYELGGVFGIGWRFDVANRDQYERLLVDTYDGLCDVQRQHKPCDAIQACQSWVKLRGSNATARFALTLSAASAVSRGENCDGKWTWPAVCQAYHSVVMSGLSSEDAQIAARLAATLREEGFCPDIH